MLTIISTPETIHGVSFAWKGIEPNDVIGPRTQLELNPVSHLGLTITGDVQLKCSECNVSGVLLNFNADEKLLLSPRKTGNWVGIIALEFSAPVFSAGARIGVVSKNSPRPFRGIIRAIETNGKEHIQSFRTQSTNTPDNSALFLGATSTGATARLKKLEFDVEPVIGEPSFKLFAIGSLIYKTA